MTPLTLPEIPQHLSWLQERYLEKNGEPMSPAEVKWWNTWMHASVGLNLAYKRGNCFIYLAPQDQDSVAVIAVYWPEEDYIDAGLLYAEVCEKCNPDVYIPLGTYWIDMLPFVRMKSIRKWIRGQRRHIALMTREADQSFVMGYVDE